MLEPLIKGHLWGTPWTSTQEDPVQNLFYLPRPFPRTRVPQFRKSCSGIIAPLTRWTDKSPSRSRPGFIIHFSLSRLDAGIIFLIEDCDNDLDHLLNNTDT